MHNFTINRLQQFADQARQEDDPQAFLRLLSPLHAQWHGTTRSVGFLLFHWHVVGHLQALGLDELLGVTGYDVADFDNGAFADAGWTDSVGRMPASQSLNDLILYSRALEGWHNEAHMVVGEATGRGMDMMNPRVNVFFPEFWNLHTFINRRFEPELATYASANHPSLSGAAAIVAHVESEHPATVASI